MRAEVEMLSVSKLVKRAPSAAAAISASAVEIKISVPSPAFTAPTPLMLVPAVKVSAAVVPVMTAVAVELSVATTPPVFVLAFSVVMPVSNAPKVSFRAPETFTVVGPAAKVTVLFEVFDTTFNVSMPVDVNVPPVWLDKVRLAVSAVPAITVAL